MMKDGTARHGARTVPGQRYTWYPRTMAGALVVTTGLSTQAPSRIANLLRHIHDYFHHRAGCTIFSTIDIVRAYQQIPVHQDDVLKTAITTPFGLFEFPFMSFGLRNPAQTFQ
jgi:hypothetical protein